MPTPESHVEQHALVLRLSIEGGGTIGSAIVLAIAALRRSSYEHEAENLEVALEQLAQRCVEPTVMPEHLRDEIDAFVRSARPTGSFVEAVLCNDLRGAIGRADAISLKFLPLIVKYLRDNAPSSCWGSEKAVAEWRVMPSLDRKEILRAFDQSREL